jgi:hypothetical protein
MHAARVGAQTRGAWLVPARSRAWARRTASWEGGGVQGVCRSTAEAPKRPYAGGTRGRRVALAAGARAW